MVLKTKSAVQLHIKNGIDHYKGKTKPKYLFKWETEDCLKWLIIIRIINMKGSFIFICVISNISRVIYSFKQNWPCIIFSAFTGAIILGSDWQILCQCLGAWNSCKLLCVLMLTPMRHSKCEKSNETKVVKDISLVRNDLEKIMYR